MSRVEEFFVLHESKRQREGEAKGGGSLKVFGDYAKSGPVTEGVERKARQRAKRMPPLAFK